jgi:chromosome segregation ATPase
MERKGIRTERGDTNREIEITNKQLRQTRARINHLKDWLKTEAANTAPPTLTEVISEILNSENGASRYAKIRDLKTAAAVLNFLTSNHITDMAGLNAKVGNMNSQLDGVSDKLKKVERRIKTLGEHIRHSENFKNYRGHKAKYERLYAEYKTAKTATGLFAERKAQKALDTANEYHETHRAEITLYEAAERHLRDVLQGRFDQKNSRRLPSGKRNTPPRLPSRKRFTRTTTACVTR